MDAAEVLREVLERSGLTKSALCARAKISRSTLDEYLRGKKQPSYAQVLRIADAAGCRITTEVRTRPRPLHPEFVAVMELVDHMGRTRDVLPDLMFPADIWRRTA